MKYQVLARKYRPKTFTTMMGQEHVLKALSNALNTERLHHAYLFTGTRGVGKTTVARVLAKALNCEQGISASPCGECAACQEIDQGRFIDLIEVDAASKTKVEDTRELLDNVQYAPTRGRFKIYLIDEVHMLSGHSFNALLKTLEEPPPHAKFLLATTDPQKLPVTILSRCLQFNLKSLSIEQIEQQLQYVLNTEEISFENNILKPLAIAADGSMRDALSLLDQAIAYSEAKPCLADIEAMLGSVQKSRIFELLAALAEDNGRLLVEQSRILTGQGIDVNTILAELISTLQRVALCQMVPDAIDDSLGDKQGIEQIAQRIAPEDVQLYYQIAINGRKDLPYSPQPQGGFEMILLRMLAFRPQSSTPDKSRQLTQTRQKTSQNNRLVSAPAASSQAVSQKANVFQNNNSAAEAIVSEKKTVPDSPEVNNAPAEKPVATSINVQPVKQQTADTPGQDKPVPDMNVLDDCDLPPIDAYAQDSFLAVTETAEYNMQDMALHEPGQTSVAAVHNNAVEKKEISPIIAQKSQTQKKEKLQPEVVHNRVATHTEPVVEQANVVPLFKEDQKKFKNDHKKPVCTEENTGELADYWHDLIIRSELDGLEQQLAKHCALVNKTEQNGEQIFDLLLESVHKHLLNDKIFNRLLDMLQKLSDLPLKLNIEQCQVPSEKQFDTPRRREIHDAEVLQQQAEESINNDPGVQMIINAFSAKVRAESIKPI